MKPKLPICLVSTLLIFILGLFTERVAGSDCRIKTAQQLFSAIKETHPELKINEKLQDVTEATVKDASERPNPVLNLSSQRSSLEHPESSESHFTLQHVFELGSKQSSRVESAQAQKFLNDFKNAKAKDDILMKVAFKIQRLSQVHSLLELYQESIKAFRKTKNTLTKNKSLSPEQKVQEDMLELEVGKHRLRIGSLEAEKIELQRLLQYYVGDECEFNIDVFRFIYPKPESVDPINLHFPQAVQLKMEKEAFRKELDLESSMAYPDLRIGPSLQFEEEQGHRIERYGLAVTMDLPILNTNAGGKARARKQLEIKTIEAEAFEDKNQALSLIMQNRYRELITALDESPSKTELFEKHHRIERYFIRGLISISTMLEGHDQVIAAIENRHNSESLALRTLLEIKQAENQLESFLTDWSTK